MDESNLFKHIAVIIENRKESIASRANCEVTLRYWEVGHCINTTILEGDLEKAILVELEKFLLEFGHGFSFVERQKRMTMERWIKQELQWCKCHRRCA